MNPKLAKTTKTAAALTAANALPQNKKKKTKKTKTVWKKVKQLLFVLKFNQTVLASFWCVGHFHKCSEWSVCLNPTIIEMLIHTQSFYTFIHSFIKPTWFENIYIYRKKKTSTTFSQRIPWQFSLKCNWFIFGHKILRAKLKRWWLHLILVGFLLYAACIHTLSSKEKKTYSFSFFFF